MTLLRPAPLAALAALAAGVILSTCNDNQGPKTLTEPSPSAATSPGPATLVGAGNISRCNKSSNDDATANLLDGIPGTV